MTHPLWSHQAEAIRRARLMDYFALWFEMGTGKTRTAIEICKEKFKHSNGYGRILVFTPPIVVNQFRQEWLRFSGMSDFFVHALLGSQDKRVKMFHEHGFLEWKPLPGVFITNYESLNMPHLFRILKAWEPEAIIFDESSKIKSPSAKRSKLAYELAQPQPTMKDKRQKPLVYLLSGTPILNSAMDIFQQVKIMMGGFPIGPDNMQELDHNFFAFRARYFRDKNSGMPAHRHFPDWVPKTLTYGGKDALNDIKQIINNIGMRVTKDECLDLPEEISVTIPVGMTTDQKRIYEDLKRDFVAYVGEGACVAALAITRAMRLMQVVSGHVKLDQVDKPVTFDLTPKDEALCELLDEITPNAKVILWCVFKQDYERIGKILTDRGIGYVRLTGEDSTTEKNDAVARFKDDESVRCLIGNPGSGGLGLNLVVAPYSIFYSRTFNLEHYLQSRARNHRGGQTSKVTHYDLVCEGTIDEIVLARLSQKIDLSERLLGQKGLMDLGTSLAKQDKVK